MEKLERPAWREPARQYVAALRSHRHPRVVLALSRVCPDSL